MRLIRTVLIVTFPNTLFVASGSQRREQGQ
jgi:hypothetical protein